MNRASLLNTNQASGTAPGRRHPVFETNLQETLGIRKFLIMSLEDVQDQLKRAAKDPNMHTKRFRAMKVNAIVVTAWLTSALETVDDMLGAPHTKETKQ